jgi:hypothetical protein
MTKHTPGPWAGMETMTGALSINVSPQVPIGTVGGAGRHLGEETARANARLIAAAPDMLAALRAMVAFVATDGPAFSMIPEETWNAARYAITKAQGED